MSKHRLRFSIMKALIWVLLHSAASSNALSANYFMMKNPILRGGSKRPTAGNVFRAILVDVEILEPLSRRESAEFGQCSEAKMSTVPPPDNLGPYLRLSHR